MDILIPVGWVVLYFFIGTFIAILIDGKDSEHLIGFATFWPVIVAMFLAAVVIMLPLAFAQTLHDKFTKKK